MQDSSSQLREAAEAVVDGSTMLFYENNSGSHRLAGYWTPAPTMLKLVRAVSEKGDDLTGER